MWRRIVWRRSTSCWRNVLLCRLNRRVGQSSRFVGNSTWHTFRPWRWRQYVAPKFMCACSRLHCVKIPDDWYCLEWSLWKREISHSPLLMFPSPCSPYVNRCFGGTYHFHLQGRKSPDEETNVQQSSVNASTFWDIAPCSPMWPDVSEELITSIFRVENQLTKEPASSRWLA
jgi:hypothetical protein